MPEIKLPWLRKPVTFNKVVRTWTPSGSHVKAVEIYEVGFPLDSIQDRYCLVVTFADQRGSDQVSHYAYSVNGFEVLESCMTAAKPTAALMAWLKKPGHFAHQLPKGAVSLKNTPRIA